MIFMSKRNLTNFHINKTMRGFDAWRNYCCGKEIIIIDVIFLCLYISSAVTLITLWPSRLKNKLLYIGKSANDILTSEF